MILIAIASLMIFILFIFSYFRIRFSHKRESRVFYGLALLLNLGTYVFVDLQNLSQSGIFLMMGAMMLAIWLLFYVNIWQLLYVGGLYIFSLYSSRGIVISSLALLKNVSLVHVFDQDFLYYITFFFAVQLSILTSVILQKKILSKDHEKQLMEDELQLKFVVVFLLLQLLYLLIINNGRFWGIDFHWFSVLYLISCIGAKIEFMFIVRYTAQVSALLKYERYTRKYKKQLDSQLRHYRSYQQYTESFKLFMHDYKHMMGSIRTLLRENENEKAIELVNTMHDTMQDIIQIHKTYSDNLLLDAVLQDVANECQEKHIRFSARLHFPDSIPLNDLDTIRVFSNIFTNVIEANLEVPEAERFLEIKSGGDKKWLVIEVTNAFNGEINIRNNRFLTTKRDKENHGMGLHIIKETIERVNGLVIVDANKEIRRFSLMLHIPLAIKDDVM